MLPLNLVLGMVVSPMVVDAGKHKTTLYHRGVVVLHSTIPLNTAPPVDVLVDGVSSSLPRVRVSMVTDRPANHQILVVVVVEEVLRFSTRRRSVNARQFCSLW